MIKSGYGGRGGSSHNDLDVLAGLLGVKPSEPLPPKRCANAKCGRVYRPRADGDDYCTEACDLDANTRFRARKGTSGTDDDPSWENARRVIER